MPESYFYPWLFSNLISIGLIILAYKLPRLTIVLWSFIFLAAGVVNAYTSITTPEDYLNYQDTAIGLYRHFINGFFGQHITPLVLIIAFGQLAIGVSLFFTKFRRIALTGAIIFLLAITPLGFGSGFPATLLMVWSLAVLLKKVNRQPAKH